MIIYEIIMIVLACISLSTIFIENIPVLTVVDNIIIIIFIIDYIVRFYLAENKKEFFKNNIVDLISSLPFNALFKGLRIFKIFRLFKFTKLTKLTKFIALTSRIIKNS